MQATTNVYYRESGRSKKRKESRPSKVSEPLNISDELLDLITDEDPTITFSGGFLAIFVICFLLGLIALVTYLTMPYSEKNEDLAPVFFSDIFRVNSLATLFEYSWTDDYLIFKNSSGNFYFIKIGKNNATPFLLLEKKNYRKGMEVSFDLTTWLIPVHQRKGDDLEDEYTYALFQTSKATIFSLITIGGDLPSYFTSIAWGPRSKYMVAVYRRNIYYSFNPLVAPSFICISCKMNQRKYYGRFLGSYKESIFKTNKAFWCYKTGQLLMFLSFSDDADKKVMVNTFDSKSMTYKYHNISYAQAGSSPLLFEVEIHVINVVSQRLSTLNLDQFVPFRPYYIVHIQWYNDTSILVSIFSSRQTKAVILACDILDLSCFTIFEKDYSYWINTVDYQNLLIDSRNDYVYIAMGLTDEDGGRRYLGRIKLQRRQSNMITWFKQGKLSIYKLNFLDPRSQFIYYQAKSTNKRDNHFYRINIRTEEITCETCIFTSCTLNEIESVDLYYSFIHRCLESDPEKYWLIKLKDNGYISTILEENRELNLYLKNKSLSKVEHLSLNVGDDQSKRNIKVDIFHPRHLNQNHVIQYPVLIIISDKSEGYMLSDSFSFGWIDYLTSYLNFVVIRLNIKGTRDHKLFFPTSTARGWRSGNLNRLLTQIKKLIKRRYYMDNSSIGIIGENYGGFLTVQMMEDDQSLLNIRCGVAVNPIADFRAHDVFLSGQYIGEFQEYSTQYMNSILRATPSLNQKELLLVQSAKQNEGLFDSSAKFIKDLVSQNIQFDLLILYQRMAKDDDWKENKYALKKITKHFVNCFNRSSTQYSILRDNVHL